MDSNYWIVTIPLLLGAVFNVLCIGSLLRVQAIRFVTFRIVLQCLSLFCLAAAWGNLTGF